MALTFYLEMLLSYLPLIKSYECTLHCQTCTAVVNPSQFPFSVMFFFSFFLFIFLVRSHPLSNIDCPVVSFAGIYSPNAYRGFAREFIKDLERIR